MILPSRGSRAIHAVVLSIIGIALVMRAATPPAVVPATAPPTDFSAARAMRHVRAMAERPHPSGSADIERVRAYVMNELQTLGLEPTVQDATGVGTRYRMAGRVQNIVARMPGTARSGRAVMLVSHYDSQGASPGAGDAASGTAAILESVRALGASPRLPHDVVILITDAEEAGLLGAAAFAREHPWARDVEMTLNFEARGTEGRSFMFETGRGNLDGVRVLRTVPNVSAASLMVMVYRILPNDTDLSELMVLEKPAMNFGFIDGVERYHTGFDDVAHLDARSMQHHGNQALALTRAFASGPLPRPVTGDAVFFDLPFIGLVAYPEPWAVAIGLLAAALVGWTLWRTRTGEGRMVRDSTVAFVGGLLALVASVIAAIAMSRGIDVLHAQTGWHGAPEWRGIYAAAVAALVVAITTAAWSIVRRWSSLAGATAGALLLWGMLAVAVSLLAPGASYLLVWPLIASCVVTLLVRPGHTSGGWRRAHWGPLAMIASTAFTMTMLLPLVYLLGTALGIEMSGAAAAALVTALGAWLVAGHLELLAGSRRWMVPAIAAGASLLLFTVGAGTVRASQETPIRRNHMHEVDLADSSDSTPPAAELISDSLANGMRDVTFRVRAPPQALGVRMQTNARVRAARIGGRAVDTTRYRRNASGWDITFVAPPDSGYTVALTVPAGTPLDLQLTARLAGVPAAVTAAAPRDSTREAPSAQGDATFVRRRVRL